MTYRAMSSNTHFQRRQMLQLTALGAIAFGASSEVATGQESAAALPLPKRPLPVVDARFPVEVASGVFILLDKRVPLVPNIGIIVGRDTVLIVDCGLGIDSAESVLALARRLAPGRQVVLTVTHAHPEHGFGAQVFKNNGRIYYNALQKEYLGRAGQKLLDGFRTNILPPNHRYLLDNIVLTPPDQTYDQDHTTLDLGGRTVEFRTWGKAHTPGDQIVFLPDERIVFTGDLAEERMFPIVPLFPPMITAQDMNISQWEIALGDMLKLQPNLVVPGHGSIGGPEILAEVLAYFGNVRQSIGLATNVDRHLIEHIRAEYPTWENSEFIEPAVRYFLQET